MHLKISTLMRTAFICFLYVISIVYVVNPFEVSQGFSVAWRVIFNSVFFIVGPIFIVIFMLVPRRQKQRRLPDRRVPAPRWMTLGYSLLLLPLLLAMLGCFGTNFIITSTTNYAGNRLVAYSLLGGVCVGCITIIFLVVQYFIDRRRNDLY